MADGPTVEQLVGAVDEMDAAVAAARSDVLVAAGPFALAVLGWAMIRRKRRMLAEHLAAVDAIVAESHDVPPTCDPADSGSAPGGGAAGVSSTGGSSAGGGELVDVGALEAELARDREAERRRV